MNETRTPVVDTRFADLPNGLFDNCKIAVLMLGISFIEPTRITENPLHQPHAIQLSRAGQGSVHKLFG
jgi:hypothetical protein